MACEARYAVWMGVLLAACGPQSSVRPEVAAQSAPVTTAEGKRADPFEQALDHLRQGRYQEAESPLRAAIASENAAARFELAQLLLLLGRHDEVGDALSGLSTPRAQVLRAQAKARRGKLAQALHLLEDQPQTSTAERQQLAFLRGQLLLRQGKRSEAAEPLSWALAQLNAAEPNSALWAGRAAHLLRLPEQANAAFNQAEIAGEPSRELLLARAQLYLDHHDSAHAAEVMQELLAAHPHHPDVLLAAARVRLETGLDFGAAEELAARVLAVDPHRVAAHNLLAGIFLREMQIEPAQARLKTALAVDPSDLQALSLQAASYFLADDEQSYQTAVEHVLALSPGYAELFSTVAGYAEWEHRYPQMITMLRRATRLDRQHAASRALLGLTLVRAGSDAAGVVELARAYELDPFDLRVVNTLNLYESIIAKEYEEFRQGAFVYRFPRAEAALLRRYVPALLERAYAEMVQRYGYEPLAPIGIEIYQNHQEFAVRTSGLPHTPIAGVCFGRKVATVSPIGAPGNLGMTLWHELGHVFHIGLSDHRVPRWMTEGLAEWETHRRQVGWSRELDRELVVALRAGSLPPLSQLNRAFTRARSSQDVAAAYYASGLAAEWMVERSGEAAAKQLLAKLGEKHDPATVLPTVLQAPADQLDQEFLGWLKARLAHLEGQFLLQPLRVTLNEAKDALGKNPQAAETQLQLAHALLAAGDAPAAHQLLTNIEAGDSLPQAQFLLSQVALKQNRPDEAAELLQGMIDSGADGFEVRLALARLALLHPQGSMPPDSRSASGRHNEALGHLKKASELDPRAPEPWTLLADWAHDAADVEAELRALRKWALLSEHDPRVHQRLIELLLAENRAAEAATVAERAVWANLASIEMHQWAGLAYARAGNSQKANFEWESALLCPASTEQVKALQQVWVTELRRTGRPGAASRISKRLDEYIAAARDPVAIP